MAPRGEDRPAAEGAKGERTDPTGVPLERRADGAYMRIPQPDRVVMAPRGEDRPAAGSDSSARPTSSLFCDKAIASSKFDRLFKSPSDHATIE
jgi:hypothetical protein